ncbi:TATA box-binding protein-associated factor RNA polymerase I subunit A isoform X2 [Salmo trutta]|uniref:TATA box-binding protein-associated factor RNA polymerase I subunit A isoform X2 n=1 Tax=Salmo trutta TaxID=8032 RepID=UPI001132409C|nr:TATA box-binding protein-associated factor RNA polymerase I subunit A isoform X2 [Salmo trutta]
MDDLESEPRVPGEEQGENESSDDDESINRKRIKKQNLPLAPPLFKETPCETGFHKTTRNCLQHIREDLLHNRWQDAADYMASYSQTLEDTTANMPQLYAEIIWRIGTEILHHHPDSKLEDYNSFYERVKHSGVKNYLKVCLEHSFHLLVNGQFEDAKRQLSIAESWRYGKLSAGQSQRIRLIQAYSGFLDYFIWCDKKATASSTDEYDAAVNQEMHSYFRQSSVNLKEIMKLPGVWDPFVLSYIDMLEFYNDHEGAVKVLNDYAYDKSFPPNPNAHVYLYRYMKKQNHPLKKLLKVLKSEKEGDLQKALGVVLDLLDYSSWRSNLDVWNHLMNIIKRLRMKKQWLKIFAEEMGYRKDWWLAIHFSTFQARKDSAENRELLEVKSFVVGAFCPRYTSMYCGVGKAGRKGVTSEVQKAKRNPKQLRNIRRLRRESGQQSQD